MFDQLTYLYDTHKTHGHILVPRFVARIMVRLLQGWDFGSFDDAEPVR